MTSEELNAYKNGFIAGLDMKEGFKYHIFGYDVREILDILEKHYTSTKLIVDHVDKQPMIIKRNGKIVYQD